MIFTSSNKKKGRKIMGVIVFGFVLFAVATPIAWLLEKIGVLR